jgi:class 3 adenylate cyclase/tetratricopeptide (TPR) repeat protein
MNTRHTLAHVQICDSCGEENPDQARFCMACTAPLRMAAPAGSRKTVTIIFSDLVGSTSLGESLDPEALREVLDRYFTEMRTCVERHGGIIEKYIGDAVMAVFGLPRAHEDDATRALRAAADMRIALGRMNDELKARWGVTLTNRTGVHTGEVVTGDPATGQRLVTGDAVNTAARLEQAAPHGEVLVGAPTVSLATDHAQLEAVEPVAAKGKAKPLPAYRLVSIREGSLPARRADVAMVGRGGELDALLQAFDRACSDRVCVLASVIGEAGVGKTKLVAELLSRVADRARIAEGRCLSYGEGITYWPLAQIVRQLAGIGEADARDVAIRKLEAICEGVTDADAIVERVSTAMGLETSPIPKEELAWGFRKLLEHVGADRPLAVVLDDIHWAHPPLLEAIAHVATLATATPLLLVCMARPQLEEDSAGWAGDVREHLAVQLEPLSESETEAMVAGLIGDIGMPEETLSDIVAAAEGNPLFLEQMLSMWQDDGTLVLGSSGWGLARRREGLSIPPSIQALLAARLDSLIEQERAVLERGAIVGQVFPTDAVEAMSSDIRRAGIGAMLGVLERKRLIRPDDASLLEDPSFAFVHLLVRDAAYTGMLRRLRAELHERFADWLLARVGDRLPEFEEIVGYHLEQSFRNLLELGPADDRTTGLKNRAADHLIASARRVFATSDMRAAALLFDRVNDLLSDDDPRLPDALLSQGTALVEAGGFDRARSVLARAEEVARSVRDHHTLTLIRLARVRLALMDETTMTASDLRSIAEKAVDHFRSSEDDLGLARALHTLGEVDWLQGHFAEAERSFRQAMIHAERVGEEREVRDNLAWMAVGAYSGPIEVDAGLARCSELIDRAHGDRLITAFTKHCEGGLLAMRGDFQKARDAIHEGRGILEEFGWVTEEAAASQVSGHVEILAGDLVAAERELRRGCEILIRIGERGYLSTTAGILANVLAGLDELEEAERYIALSAETGSPDDGLTQVEWRTARAEVLLKRGNFAAAIRDASDAVEIAYGTDSLNMRGNARRALARVYRAAGRTPEAIEQAGLALTEFERKGNIVSAAGVQRFLDELG